MAEGHAGFATPEDYEAAGLYDPEAPHAAQKLELLQLLSGFGMTVDDMRGNGDRLAALVPYAVIRQGKELFPIAELANRAGMSLELTERIWRSAGFADPGDARLFTDDDVAALQLVQLGLMRFDEETALRFVRVLGASVARIIEAAISMFLVHGVNADARDPVGLELARVNALAASRLPQLDNAVSMLLRHNLGFAERSTEAMYEAGRGYDGVKLTVGFIDLVGSTEMSHRLDPVELTAALTDFESLVTDIVVGRNGRVVKLIGDEAMFVCADPELACLVALEVSEAAARTPSLPATRAGLARGEVVARDGDYFGRVVNLAARAVAQAEPGRVLVDSGVATRLARDHPDLPRAFRIGASSSHRLKGFEDLVELHDLERI